MKGQMTVDKRDFSVYRACYSEEIWHHYGLDTQMV